MFLGIQGPQGSGKSYLTDLLPRVLSAPPHNLRLAALSLDDLYLPYEKLCALAGKYPENKLLNGRGQPGTHDLPLALDVFAQLASINDASASRKSVHLPIFDKSKHAGKGDRSSETVQISGPVDIMVFEGWCNGFRATSQGQLENEYKAAQRDPTGYGSKLGYEKPFFLQHQSRHLLQINEMLEAYQTSLWEHLDCFVQLQPESMSYVWKWRLQQEHNMKAKNGGVGMTDDEVEAFIGRYMPGYELFLDGISAKGTPWEGRGYRLLLDDQRSITSEDFF